MKILGPKIDIFLFLEILISGNSLNFYKRERGFIRSIFLKETKKHKLLSLISLPASLDPYHILLAILNSLTYYYKSIQNPAQG